jgi:hypothetical protein
MPPTTRRITAIRKNIDYVARSTYQKRPNGNDNVRTFSCAKEAIAYVRAGQRLCIDVIPTEPVLQMRVRRRVRRPGIPPSWFAYARTPNRRFVLHISCMGTTDKTQASVAADFGAPHIWFDRIDRRIEWRRTDIIMETLALAMHPRAGRNSPVYRASQHPLFDKNIFTVLLNRALGRLPEQRNVLE